MTLSELLDELSEAEVDECYVIRALARIITEGGIEDVAAKKLQERFRNHLLEWHVENQSEEDDD